MSNNYLDDEFTKQETEEEEKKNDLLAQMAQTDSTGFVTNIRRQAQSDNTLSGDMAAMLIDDSNLGRSR